MRITSFDLLSVQKKKTRILSYESIRFRAIWETWTAPPNIWCFLNGKARFWSVYVFFINIFGSKIRTLFFLLTTLINNFTDKFSSLKIDRHSVELSGKTAMISTKPRPPQNYSLFWIDHLVGKSSFKRRTEVFSFYRWNIEHKWAFCGFGSQLALLWPPIRQIYNEIFSIICPHLTYWQHGFLPGKSTVSQLSQVVHQFANALKRRQQIDVIYLDFFKALDRLSHEKLLFKLECLGIVGSLLAWFRSYLSGIVM